MKDVPRSLRGDVRCAVGVRRAVSIGDEHEARTGVRDLERLAPMRRSTSRSTARQNSNS
jgi:hypothetical protein